MSDSTLSPTTSEAWGLFHDMLQRGWCVQCDPESRGCVARRNKAVLHAIGSTWEWTIKNLHTEVLGMGPYQDCSRLHDKNQVSSDRMSAYGALAGDTLSGVERVALIGESCLSLGLPTSQFTIKLDLSRAINPPASVERAVAVFSSSPIAATVTQRGSYWDRCTELVLEWPRDKNHTS